MAEKGVALEAYGLEAEDFAGAGVDQDVEAGVEIIDGALDMGDPAWIVRIGAELVDGAMVLDVADQDVEEITRALVQPSPRRHGCKAQRMIAIKLMRAVSHGLGHTPFEYGVFDAIEENAQGLYALRAAKRSNARSNSPLVGDVFGPLTAAGASSQDGNI